MAIDDLSKRYPALKKILIIPPDFTRCYSMAGEITRILYEKFHERAEIHIMPAVGTHMPLIEEERFKMFGESIPEACFLHHKWQSDTVPIGVVPREFLAEISRGLFAVDVEVELNRRVVEGGYDLVLSVGQVVPHEVAGMANYSKNIFVGVGGRNMINKSHMLGAVCGTEQALGNDHTPVRRLFDYAQEKFLKDIPLVYILTVTTRDETGVHLNGLFVGSDRTPFEKAVALSKRLNITYLEKPVRKVVTYLDEFELKSTWVGNKGLYRTRMIIADGGELVLLAPGVRTFGENEETDLMIRKYGYKGRDYVLDLYERGAFGNRAMVAAHLIHGSSDGRFSITYATDGALLSKEEVESVGYRHMEIKKAYDLYNPKDLREGFNVLPNGEEIYYVGTPALGLWKVKETE
ncbi:MAG: lactate racemase domain-containing protein [Synergistaceae bacterium]|nr:lactate racemase domain-containing protein [Synergistaceae bacterium]